MSIFDANVAADSSGPLAYPSPTVSKSQWTNFALAKLRDGHVLVQSPASRGFQFYKPGTPLQPCPAHAAKKLLAMGLLSVVKTDIRGTHYGLPDAFQPEAAPSA